VLKNSIVSLSFNRARYPEDLLLSLKRENHSKSEHIAMDGASTDGPVESYSTIAGCQVGNICTGVRSLTDSQADAINKSLTLAPGDILAYLCADDA